MSTREGLYDEIQIQAAKIEDLERELALANIYIEELQSALQESKEKPHV